jgi:transmembrane 6 superfamily
MSQSRNISRQRKRCGPSPPVSPQHPHRRRSRRLARGLNHATHSQSVSQSDSETESASLPIIYQRSSYTNTRDDTEQDQINFSGSDSPSDSDSDAVSAKSPRLGDMQLQSLSQSQSLSSSHNPMARRRRHRDDRNNNDIQCGNTPTVKVRSNPWRVSIGVIVISLLSIPVMAFLRARDEMSDHMNVFYAGVVFCTIVLPITLVLVWRTHPHLKHSVFFYMCTLFAFTAIVDLFIAFDLDGITNLIGFYMREGEPYLQSPHGLAINYWDGTVHFALYIIQCHQMAANRRRGTPNLLLSLYWAGSILNSLVVFLPGNLIGQFRHEIRASYFLNTPYVLLPIWWLMRSLNAPLPATASRRTRNRGSTRQQLFMQRRFDSLLVLCGVAVAIFHVFRALAVGGAVFAEPYLAHEPYLLHPTLYPILQVITYAFTSPILLYLLHVLAFPTPARMKRAKKFAALYGGMVAQGQFAYMLGAVHAPAGELYTDASAHWQSAWSSCTFWYVNISFVVFAQLLAYRICVADKTTTVAATKSRSRSKTKKVQKHN